MSNRGTSGNWPFEQIRVPDLLRLIALKLHATRDTNRRTSETNWQDVAALLRTTEDLERKASRKRLDGWRSRYESLTAREKDVLAHVVTGKLNKQISAEIGASERTVKAHRAHIMEKMQVNSVAELVRIVEHLRLRE
jgi:FixJ family two-component response regulator